MSDEPENSGETRSDGRFKPGQSGNPAGKPKGARHKLGEAFLEALKDDFEVHGALAISQTRESDPAAYCRVIASLLPKEVKIEATSDLTDEQLDQRIRQLANALEIGIVDAADREPKAQSQNQAQGLQTVQ